MRDWFEFLSREYPKRKYALATLLEMLGRMETAVQKSPERASLMELMLDLDRFSDLSHKMFEEEETFLPLTRWAVSRFSKTQ
jgi:hypothetical protein